MEFVDHQALEGIPNRIDKVDPSEPGFHITRRDREPGVDNQPEHEDSGRRKRTRYRLGSRSDGPEDTRHRESSQERDEEEEEEGTRGATEVGHEVEGGIECDRG